MSYKGYSIFNKKGEVIKTVWGDSISYTPSGWAICEDGNIKCGVPHGCGVE